MLNDPRLEKLSFEEKSWLKFWDKRIYEIRNEGDPLWDDPDPEQRARAKCVNLASLVRRYGGKAADILAHPMGQAHQTAEFEFAHQRYDNLEKEGGFL